MWAMTGRPCNPGSDLKGLWQTFLGNTPMPRCGTPSDPQPAEDPKDARSDPGPVQPAASKSSGR